MNRQLTKFFEHSLVISLIALLAGCQSKEVSEPGWPAITRETKPWTRWWWHGNALTKEGITAEMEAYQKAGLGGLEITPIYGVLGYEDKFVNYLSPEWMDLFHHTLKEAERLNMGIDMATGTGWPFGGPWVNSEDACKDMNYKIYELAEGKNFMEKIEFMQQPYLRAVGNQLYEVNDNFSTVPGKPIGNRKEPVMRMDPSGINIKQLVEPISSNQNLQALALDQVKFEKPLPLKVLMGFSDKGKVIDLTKLVDSSGKLKWTASDGNWKLYAVFEGWHGKMVERAGPGGEGDVIDHFSSIALQHYLNRFDSAFAGKDIRTLRAFFNDSYEVDDARGAADFTPTLFEEFQKRRGYNLREHLPALFGQDDENKSKRVLCDYRETIGELLLENFTQAWKMWANSKSAVARNQAHGSPANILDLYATVDIPEIEGVEPLRIKMASSAGNVTGKRLVSSESATWLNEHFESNLSDIKGAVDRFLLNGVNHIFYHGTSYSPPNEAWPGWLFYAAVHLNPRNPLWNDFDALNQYVARCQSLLQNSVPDNDVLLYFPIYDRFSAPGPEMIEHFDGVGKIWDSTSFKQAAETMLKKGYSFDYVSDKQIRSIVVNDGMLQTEGNTTYKTIVIPSCRYIPLSTFQKVILLAQQGATVIALEGFPSSVSGYGNFQQNESQFNKLISNLGNGQAIGQGITEIKTGKGRILMGDRLDDLLGYTSVRKETMIDQGIDFIRKERDNRTLYFVSNRNDKPFEGWLPLQVLAKSAVLYNPMTGEFGKAKIRTSEPGFLEIFVQLSIHQTLFIETYKDEPRLSLFKYHSAATTNIPIIGKWTITFTSGGPENLPTLESDTLTSWTGFGKSYEAFSGTATYSISFNRPRQASKGWLLDLGVVKESADVVLNGKRITTLIGPVYQIYLDDSILQQTNQLEVCVSNSMANRIAWMDKQKKFWRKFYNVNFPARKSENRKNGLFDASAWKPRDSGLMGPVILTAVE
jgi:hypothetical protein